MITGKTIALTIWTFVGKVMSLLFNMLSRFVMICLSKSKRLLISWLQSPSTVILEPNKIKPATVSTISPLFIFKLITDKEFLHLAICFPYVLQFFLSLILYYYLLLCLVDFGGLERETVLSHDWLFLAIPWTIQSTMFLCPWDSPGKNTRAGCHFLLQGNFVTQKLNPSLLHCRQMLYGLSYTGSLEG